ncbi:MAG: endolytic transglycosylase MltG [Chitinophagaceae bacterium]|nr:endolytic transglycosylase MltG [Chitinophagaceae bacterium]
MRKILVIASVMVVVAIGIAGFLAYKVFGPSVENPDEKFLYIPTGAAYSQLKDSLRDGGFVKDFYFFDKVASYLDLQTNLKPGKYKVNNGMSVYHLVKKLRGGQQETINLVITKIRLREDLAKRIGRVFELDSATAMAFLSNNDSLKKFDVDTVNVLTDVFPDTYTYYWAADMNTIFKKLHNERNKFWNEERLAKAKALGLTPEEVYVMASIVEEETNKQEDKGKIASVYMNRLKKGMPLGADPTVKYAMKDFGLTRILFSHLQTPSPYNTYRNKGLPPGPICTPSRKTIEAVLDAPETDYLFFVARADFSGYSDFASNFTQHQQFARAYRKALDSLVRERAKNK